MRGQLVKATVHPKDGAPSYEIIVGDGPRDPRRRRNNSRGATGKRVWNVLRSDRPPHSMAVFTEVSFDEAAR